MPLTCLKAGLRWRVSWLFVAATIPVGALIGAHYLSPIINGPPVSIVTSDAIDELVHPGGMLRFRITAIIRDRQPCSGYLVREFSRRITVDGREMWEKHRLPMVPPPLADPDALEYVVAVPIPDELVAGKWRYRGRTVYDCGVVGGGIRYFDTAPVFFTIAERKPQ